MSTNSARKASASRPPVKPAAPKKKERSRLPLVGAVVVVVVVVLVGAVIITAATRKKPATAANIEQNRPVTVQGTPLPAYDDSAADPAVGTAAPIIHGQSFDGTPETVGGPTSQPTLVMFVAHWCPHCQAEVPRLQDWLDQNGMPSDVQLTAVATANTDQRENFPAGPWLREAGWSIPTMIDNQGTADGGGNDAARAVGVSAYPFFVVVDAQGKVVFRTSGEVTMPQWEQLLDSARTGQAPAGS